MKNELKIWETVTKTTVRLECHKRNGDVVTGTGFFYSFFNQDSYIPGVISNKHVIEDSARIIFFLTVAPKHWKNGRLYEPIICNVSQNGPIMHPDETIDLAFLPLATLFNTLSSDYYQYFHFSRENLPTTDEYNSMDAVERIYVVGYPEGLWDRHNNLPIVRQGITASSVKQAFEGKNIFLVDSACFPGSSGSPVIWYKEATVEDHLKKGIVPQYRHRLLGILYAIMECTAKGRIKIRNIPDDWIEIVKSKIPMNLGLCIRSDAINDWENAIFHVAKERG